MGDLWQRPRTIWADTFKLDQPTLIFVLVSGLAFLTMTDQGLPARQVRGAHDHLTDGR